MKMTNEVTVPMPLALTPEMMRAVRDDPLCEVSRDQWHARLGWLICAWDVLVAMRLPPAAPSATAPNAALRNAAGGTRFDLEQHGTNYPDIRVLLAFAEREIAAGRA